MKEVRAEGQQGLLGQCVALHCCAAWVDSMLTCRGVISQPSANCFAETAFRSPPSILLPEPIVYWGQLPQSSYQRSGNTIPSYRTHVMLVSLQGNIDILSWNAQLRKRLMLGSRWFRFACFLSQFSLQTWTSIFHALKNMLGSDGAGL